MEQVEESERHGPNLFELKFCRIAYIKQKRDCEWLMWRIGSRVSGRFKIGDLLCHAILIKVKIFPFQILDQSAVTIHYTYRQSDKGCVDANDIVLRCLLRRLILILRVHQRYRNERSDKSKRETENGSFCHGKKKNRVREHHRTSASSEFDKPLSSPPRALKISTLTTPFLISPQL